MNEFLRQTASDYDMPLEMVVSIYKKCSTSLELYDRLEEELKTTHN